MLVVFFEAGCLLNTTCEEGMLREVQGGARS
jgi:hypothetical protein